MSRIEAQLSAVIANTAARGTGLERGNDFPDIAAQQIVPAPERAVGAWAKRVPIVTIG